MMQKWERRTIAGLLLIAGLLWSQQPIDLRTSVGTTLATPSAYGTPPSGNVIGVNASVTNTPTVTISGGVNPVPQSTSTYAWTATDVAATNATQVKNAAGNVAGVYVFNPNTSLCYLQFYNSGSAVLGTNALHAIGVQAGVAIVVPPGTIALWNFGTGISTGQTTTATGSSQCSVGMPTTVFYN